MFGVVPILSPSLVTGVNVQVCPSVVVYADLLSKAMVVGLGCCSPFGIHPPFDVVVQ
jgi:hypothetical protein